MENGKQWTANNISVSPWKTRKSARICQISRNGKVAAPSLNINQKLRRRFFLPSSFKTEEQKQKEEWEWEAMKIYFPLWCVSKNCRGFRFNFHSSWKDGVLFYYPEESIKSEISFLLSAARWLSRKWFLVGKQECYVSVILRSPLSAMPMKME